MTRCLGLARSTGARFSLLREDTRMPLSTARSDDGISDRGGPGGEPGEGAGETSPGAPIANRTTRLARAAANRRRERPTTASPLLPRSGPDHRRLH